MCSGYGIIQLKASSECIRLKIVYILIQCATSAVHGCVLFQQKTGRQFIRNGVECFSLKSPPRRIVYNVERTHVAGLWWQTPLRWWCARSCVSESLDYRFSLAHRCINGECTRARAHRCSLSDPSTWLHATWSVFASARLRWAHCVLRMPQRHFVDASLRKHDTGNAVIYLVCVAT